MIVKSFQYWIIKRFSQFKSPIYSEAMQWGRFNYFKHNSLKLRRTMRLLACYTLRHLATASCGGVFQEKQIYTMRHFAIRTDREVSGREQSQCVHELIYVSIHNKLSKHMNLKQCERGNRCNIHLQPSWLAWVVALWPPQRPSLGGW